MILREKGLFQNFDWWLIAAVGFLVLLGIILINNTTAGVEGLFDTANLLQDFTFRQIIYALVGFGLLFGLSRIDYRVFAGLSWLFYVMLLAMLGAVAIIGRLTLGAQRWIPLGPFQLQPSEIGKLLIVLVLAKFLADHSKQMDKWRTLGIAVAILALPVVMTYLQPDLGTSLVFVFAWGVMVLAAGLSWKQLLISGVLLLVLLPFVWLTMQDYQRARLTAFLNPVSDPLGAGYNVTQARIAIGSGEVFGRGIGAGTQSQLQFLRIRHTDFIFSVVGEELGFFGGIFFFALYSFVLLRMLRAAQVSRSIFGRLTAVGFAAALFFQAFVNLGMNVGIMPVTGIPLPFVSSGGSSLITYLMMIGIIQSILAHEKLLGLRTKPQQV
ncbi:MAG: rod shape-determining protein RodA [Chloroflexi bacterium UTCFX4]|nr:MAG: rod shape-determining protein RodA [Chloroflexi bacterium UTCFX4]